MKKTILTLVMISASIAESRIAFAWSDTAPPEPITHTSYVCGSATEWAAAGASFAQTVGTAMNRAQNKLGGLPAPGKTGYYGDTAMQLLQKQTLAPTISQSAQPNTGIDVCLNSPAYGSTWGTCTHATVCLTFMITYLPCEAHEDEDGLEYNVCPNGELISRYGDSHVAEIKKEMKLQKALENASKGTYVPRKKK